MSAREPARVNGMLPGLCVHSTELVWLKGDRPTGYILITLPAWLNILGSFKKKKTTLSVLTHYQFEKFQRLVCVYLWFGWAWDSKTGSVGEGACCASQTAEFNSWKLLGKARPVP